MGANATSGGRPGRADSRKRSGLTMPGNVHDTQPTHTDTREDPAVPDRRRPESRVIDLSREGGDRKSVV